MEPLETKPGKSGYSYDPEGDKLSKSLYTSMIRSSKEIEFRNRNNQELDDKIDDNKHVFDENKKPHNCSICEYSTSKESDLKRHIKSVHEGKPLQCSICNYSTSREQGAKYLGFFSFRSLKTRDKYISFAQFVYFLREVCLLFNF